MGREEVGDVLHERIIGQLRAGREHHPRGDALAEVVVCDAEHRGLRLLLEEIGGALGLVAAIPAVVIYNVFSRWIAAYRAQLADGAAEVMRLVSRAHLEFKTGSLSALPLAELDGLTEGLLALTGPLLAQGTGSLAGRVINPATGGIVEHARITVEGTMLEAVSDGDGYFRLFNRKAHEIFNIRVILPRGEP